MPKSGLVEVKILDVPGPTDCCCGPGPDAAPTVQGKCEELARALAARYPGRTSVAYRNLLEHPEERVTPAGQLLVNRSVPPPVVVIAGEAGFWGRIPVLKVLERVGTLLNA